ncbi:hypothetical protein KW783_03165 [Candidatus Parcubacteria bacterium]|nr:hypothetical protein [Candidatus Parcubacteria bacterium]
MRTRIFLILNVGAVLIAFAMSGVVADIIKRDVRDHNREDNLSEKLYPNPPAGEADEPEPNWARVFAK